MILIKDSMELFDFLIKPTQPLRYLFILYRFAYSLMLLILMRPMPTVLLISMLMDLKLSIRTKPKLKNGLKSMMSSWQVIQ